VALLDSVGWRGVAHWKHLDSSQRLLAEGEDDNSLTLQGAQSILGVYFNGVTQIAQNAWYLALYTTTLDTGFAGAGAPNNEQSGSGYARINIPTWTLTQFGLLWRVNAPLVQFSATGTWGTVTALGFVNASSGQATNALSFINLSTPRSLLNGDFLQVLYSIQLT